MTSEFTEKDIEDIDKVLIKNNIPPLQRPDKALEMLSLGGPLVPSLNPNYKKICDWYKKMYEKEMLPNWKIGEKPFKLRGHIYYIKYLALFGRKPIDVLNCIQNLTSEMTKSLTPAERESIKENFRLGYEAFRAINGVSSLHKDAQELVDLGINDLHGSVSTLKETNDPQSPIFQAHAASEKFLKAFLVQSGAYNKEEVKQFGHKLIDILNECITINPVFQSISNNVSTVNLPDMRSRYSKTAHTQEDAISAIDATLSICKFVANIWNPDYTNPIRFVQ